MTKQELIEALAAKTQMTKKNVEDMLDGFVGVVTEQLKADNKVAVTGFGTFSVSDRKARSRGSRD